MMQRLFSVPGLLLPHLQSAEKEGGKEGWEEALAAVRRVNIQFTFKNQGKERLDPPCRLVPARPEAGLLLPFCSSCLPVCPPASILRTYPPGPKSTHLRLDPTLLHPPINLVPRDAPSCNFLVCLGRFINSALPHSPYPGFSLLLFSPPRSSVKTQLRPAGYRIASTLLPRDSSSQVIPYSRTQPLVSPGP